MAVRYYRDLLVWRKAVELLLESYRIAARLPPAERFNLASQMCRAAVSITANIAEGHGRLHRGEYLHHLSIARGSLMELDSHVLVVERLDFQRADELATISERILEVRMMLDGLIRSLRRA